jgi:hypothetical protein
LEELHDLGPLVSASEAKDILRLAMMKISFLFIIERIFGNSTRTAIHGLKKQISLGVNVHMPLASV